MSLNNFGIVAKNLSRSAQPDAGGFCTLENLDVKLVLKLCSDSDFPLATEKSYLSYPNRIEIRQIPLDQFNLDETTVRSLVEMIQANIPDRAVHVHCSHGRDRTGLVIGAWQIFYGGLSLEDVMRQRACYGTDWLLDVTVDRSIVEMLTKFAKEKGQ